MYKHIKKIIKNPKELYKTFGFLGNYYSFWKLPQSVHSTVLATDSCFDTLI